MSHPMTITVNNRPYQLEVEGQTTLLELLRDRLNLTGAREGCGEGECGACTVLLDGAPVASCLVLALQADGREVVTIEGLCQDGQLDPLQTAFLEHGAVQCGYCTPGMVMSAKGLLNGNPSPSESDIKRAIAGNLCRCTGYVKIVEAIASVADGALNSDE